MKWFKHETDALGNLKLQSVITKLGAEAYGYYWACLELVGLQGTNFRLGAEKDWKVLLKKFLEIDLPKQETYLEFFAEKKLIDKKSLDKGDLYIPKLRERADDYTKRVRRVSEQSSDNVPLEENRREQKRTEEPFDSTSYILKMLSDKQRHIKIIGTYWQFKGYEFETIEAARASIKRDLKPARDLVGYGDEKILRTMEHLKAKAEYKWTLETVHKFIDEF